MRYGLLVALTAITASAVVAADYRATAPDADRQLAAMIDLYEDVCLRAFPDDVAVADRMRTRGASPLDAAEVRVWLHDDPGVGWRTQAAGARFDVTVEAPPYHTCSVRTMSVDGFAGATSYEALIVRYTAGQPGFAPMQPFVIDRDGVHQRLAGVGRQREDGRAETLMRGKVYVTDPKMRADGQTAVEVRFVHQIVAPAGEGHGGPAT